MANVKNLQMSLTHFLASSYRFKYIKQNQIVYLQRVGQGDGLQFSQLHHSTANVKSTNVWHIFALALTVSNINFFNIWPPKSTSRSRSTIFSISPFDGKCQNLLTTFSTFLILAKMWPVRTILTDRQSHRETDKPMAISEIKHWIRRSWDTELFYESVPGKSLAVVLRSMAVHCVKGTILSAIKGGQALFY